MGAAGGPPDGAAGSSTYAGRTDPDRLHLSLWIAVALALLADVYLPLGRAGWCVRSGVGLLWPLFAATGLAVIVVNCLRSVDRWDTPSVILLGLTVIWLAVVAVLDLVPPIARDELTHHLAIPALYVRAGRLLEVPFADQAYYPMLLEMFYTPLVAHGWEIAAKYLHLGFGLAAAALVFAYLQPRTSTPLALLSALLLLSTPTVTVLAASAYVDLGLLFYTAVALIALLRWSESDRVAYFVIAALGAGCAASVKYNGLLLVVLLTCLVLLLARERGATLAIGSAIAFGALSLIPLLPWLVKNAAETGNPIFPLFNSLLGGRPLPANPSIDVFTKRQLLYGEGWIEIALTPVRVFVTGREGDPARFDGVFNPLYLLGFAALFIRGGARRARWLVGLAVMVLVMVFLLNTFRSRYAISVLIPLALVVGEMLERG
ncbi:MAG TPA: glycosyltransferase family 39 protein, partial [Candidatus Kryptonia bacterium]|nr:glycosyltransferase family 39 protein [Candidatus Kryptonia bacterium]